MLQAILSFLRRQSAPLRHGLGRRLAYCREAVLGGGRFREFMLVKLLGQHYRSTFRRRWVLSPEPPHFFDQRIGFFDLGFGNGGKGPYSFYRGFFSSDVMRYGDRLLDIGCGDGFFTRRFYGERCAHIDAVDIEPTAIAAARSCNRAPNITYHVSDAVKDPFPGDAYNVIVWDGALGHFSADTTAHMLRKIRQALHPEGVFVGSESLGIEGSDHLQFFHSLDDLYQTFKAHFKHIELRSVCYKIGTNRELYRNEAYWRCANSPGRLRDCHWQYFGGSADER
jgi:SAM-dependent methyltransferase